MIYQSRFLWAKLQIISLRQAKSEKIIKNMLRKIPVGLDRSFERLAEAIRAQEKHAMHLAFRALDWSAWAVRPLTPDEFRYALWLGDPEETFRASEITLELILDVCQNFLKYESAVNQVMYIHSSAQRYVTERGDPEEAHRAIAIACLRSVLRPH
jgi:hypothetical protein